MPLGTIISWLFAVPSDNSTENGFSLTGGVLNYTAVVTFPQSGHSATLAFNFRGMDVFDYLKADLEVRILFSYILTFIFIINANVTNNAKFNTNHQLKCLKFVW